MVLVYSSMTKSTMDFLMCLKIEILFKFYHIVVEKMFAYFNV